MPEDANNQDSSARVKFQEYQVDRSSLLRTLKTSKLTQWIIKYSGGRIDDEKQANYVLIAFIVLAAIVSLFLIFTGGISGGKQNIYTPKSNINAR